MAADLSFTFHAVAAPIGTRRLLDGVHCLLKADLFGRTTAVKALPIKPLDTIAA